MKKTHRSAAAISAALMGLPMGASADSITLFDQDFESPVGYADGFQYQDLSQQAVNSLYGNQPVGFTFNQQATVETLNLTGGDAFNGTGYSDPTGQGGNYALGMQQFIEDDRLSLTFDTGDYDFFNLQFDLSAIGICCGVGSPFGSETVAPTVALYVFNGGYNVDQNRHNGSFSFLAPDPLGEDSVTGTVSGNTVLDWTTFTGAFDISNKTSDFVTLQFDLLNDAPSQYVALDNFLITASDEALGGIPTDPGPGTPAVPLPAGLPLLLAGLGGLALIKRRANAG